MKYLIMLLFVVFSFDLSACNNCLNQLDVYKYMYEQNLNYQETAPIKNEEEIKYLQGILKGIEISCEIFNEAH
jgi:hypothetical protein